jgi:hypothetical protein
MTEEKKQGWFRAAIEKVEAQVESQKAEQAEGAAQAGSLVIEKQFGLSRVAIYDGGFVRVGKGGLNALTSLSKYEKLKAIKYTEAVQDRSAVGKAWSGGAFSSSQRRTLHLTITTDRKVHTLSTEFEMLSNHHKAGMALEAAGQAVLDSRGSTVAVPNAPDVADQIKKLAELHAAGILTDDEFATKKAELLDRM